MTLQDKFKQKKNEYESQIHHFTCQEADSDLRLIALIRQALDYTIENLYQPNQGYWSRGIELLQNFIRLCIQFTREAVLHHNTQTPAAADLQHALDFLDGKTTASTLAHHRDSAWRDHDKLSQQNNPAAHIRRLTLTFLYPKLLHGIEEAGQPDSYDFLFLNLLWDINPSLYHQFWNYLTAHIEAA